MPETDVPWAASAPQYKKDGKLYSSVNYDHNGNPVRIKVARNQVRKGEFNINDGVAVYDEPDTIGLSDPSKEVVEYVRKFAFVDEVVV